MKKTLIGLTLLAGLSAAAQAKEELLVTVANAGKSVIAELDFASPNGQTVGFEFSLNVPAGAKANTSGCLKGLPATHTGFCQFDASANVIRGAVYSDVNATLPKGVFSIGRVSIHGGGSANTLNVSHFLAAGADAAALPSKSRVER